MSRRTKIGLGVGAGVVALAVGAFFLLGNRPGDIPLIGEVIEPPKCPLSGLDPPREGIEDRPAVAVKIENTAAAYPLSGLEDAEIVFEELVEGGVTRFMAIYHCTDAEKAGPVRSARLVDPAIMTPLTRILAYSGENQPVLDALNEAEIVTLDEDTAGDGLMRIERPGVSFEHTLYANTQALRRLGRKSFDDPPPEELSFGELEVKGKKARVVTISFSAASSITYEWNGERWERSQGGAPFVTETGDQLEVDNVLVEEHEVVLSKSIVDVAGNPSTEISDVTGTGRAVLFRDGRAIVGRWKRESIEDAVQFVTKDGDEMVLHPGTTWIELVPDDKGEVKGSFSFER